MATERLVAAALLALTLVVGAGCSAPNPTSSASPQTSAEGIEPPADPPAEPPAEEDSGVAPQQESEGNEEAAAGGGGGVTVELAGLPVGGGSTFAVGEAWCQALFWGNELPVGVSIEIDAVQIGEPGGSLQDVGCEDRPPCVGATITETERGCAVAIVPPAPAPESVSVRLDGLLRCPDQATCDQVVVAEVRQIVILPPSAGETTGEAGTGGSAEETGTGEAGTGGSAEEAGTGETPAEETGETPAGEAEIGDGSGVDPSVGDLADPAPSGG